MNYRGTTPEIRTLLREAVAAGCEVVFTGRGHFRVVTPNGPVFVSLTPRTRFAATQARADLRRKGVKV